MMRIVKIAPGVSIAIAEVRVDNAIRCAVAGRVATGPLNFPNA